MSCGVMFCLPLGLTERHLRAIARWHDRDGIATPEEVLIYIENIMGQNMAVVEDTANAPSGIKIKVKK